MYNLNAPFTFSTFNSHSRQYSGNASWAPKDWFSFDASYMKLHLDTRGGIAFFASYRHAAATAVGISVVFPEQRSRRESGRRASR